MKFEYLEQYKYLSKICLNITDDCNLRCTYCFVHHQPHFMKLQTAIDSLEFLVSNFNKKKELNLTEKDEKVEINFFGGEPTLMWDSIIVPLVKYSQNKYGDLVSFSMTTNGTLLNEEKLSWMKDNHIGLLLSMDGDKNTQDINRPCKNGSSSFDLIIKNIPKILEYFPNTTFRATISQNTVENTFNNFIFADYLGFKHSFFIPNFRDKWTKENLQKLEQEIDKIYWYIGTRLLNNQYPIANSVIEDSFRSILFHNISVVNNQISKPDIERDFLRCGMGIVYGSIGYDGKIYACQEQDSNLTNSIFYIGDIYNGVDKDRHTKLLTKFSQKAEIVCENIEKCQNCDYKLICSEQLCPSLTHDLFNSFFISSEAECSWVLALFKNARILTEYFTELKHPFFLDYLKHYCNYKQFLEEDEITYGTNSMYL